MARRFDPQWRPTFAPGRDDDPDDPDDIGWDDGSGYDGGPRHGRRPRTGVVILGVCALVTAVVSVGLTVAESRPAGGTRGEDERHAGHAHAPSIQSKPRRHVRGTQTGRGPVGHLLPDRRGQRHADRTGRRPAAGPRRTDARSNGSNGSNRPRPTCSTRPNRRTTPPGWRRTSARPRTYSTGRRTWN